MPVDTVSPSLATGPASIQQAVITAVDPDRRTCTVCPSAGGPEQRNVKFSYPWLSSKHKGMKYCPDEGTLCYVCTPADKTGSFIMGYIVEGEYPDTGPSTGNESHAGKMPRSERGDIIFDTDDGNFVCIRRGGIVQIGSDQTCQTMYFPLESLVRQYYRRYQAFSPIGELVWDHAQITQESLDDASGEIPVIMKLSCRDKIQDQKMSVEVRLGRLDKSMLDASLNGKLLNEGEKQSVNVYDKEGKVSKELLDAGDGDQEHFFGVAAKRPGIGMTKYQPGTAGSPYGLVSITVNPQGDALKWVFQINKDGDLFLRSEANIHVEAKTVFVHADDKILIETQGGAAVTLADYIKAQVGSAISLLLQNGDVKLTANNIYLKASEKITLEAPEIELKGTTGVTIASPEIGLGGQHGKGHKLLTNAEAWKTALDNHQHTYVNAAGVVTPTAVFAPAPTTGGLITDGANKIGTKITTGLGD